MKDIIIKTVVTILIGGVAYTISQSDIVQNFAEDTGLTQEQAEQYINEIPEETLVSWDEIGSEQINIGQEILDAAYEIDCVDYKYEWELATLSCFEGKTQLNKLAEDSILLGQAYVKLGSDSASEDDITETIRLIDQLNSDYQFEIVSATLDWSIIDEVKKTNSYNKAVLKAALESD